MTLSFSEKWPKRMGELAGQPNYFVDKITSTLHNVSFTDAIEYQRQYIEKTGEELYASSINRKMPKRHTIREDKTNRWKAGNDIHFVINNRTKDRFQFAPIVQCVNVQKIEIFHMKHSKNVRVDDVWLSNYEIIELAYNDGFPSVKAFFDFFNEDFVGKIIHWTDKRY